MYRTSNLIRFQLYMLKFLGVWGHKNAPLPRSLRLFSFFSICAGFILSMFAASFTLTEISEVVISPLYTYNSLLVVLKTVVVYEKAAAIEQFLLDADKVPFFTEPGEKDMKRSIVRKIEFLPKFLGALFAFGVAFMIMEPLLMEGITRCQIFPTWYSFQGEGKLTRCVAICLFETLAAVYILIAAAGVDSLVACLLFIIGGQLQSLGYRLRTLPRSNEYEWLLKFKQCVEDYKNICSLCRQYEIIFSGMLFVQASSSCLFICVSAYALRAASDTSTFMRFLCFTMSMAYQVFLPCYVGDDVVEKSEKLQFDLYSSCWPEIPGRCRKMVLILALKLKHPIIIRFGFIQCLRLETFSKIVNIAYKLYALLQQVQD